MAGLEGPEVGVGTEEPAVVLQVEGEPRTVAVENKAVAEERRAVPALGVAADADIQRDNWDKDRTAVTVEVLRRFPEELLVDSDADEVARRAALEAMEVAAVGAAGSTVEAVAVEDATGTAVEVVQAFLPAALERERRSRDREEAREDAVITTTRGATEIGGTMGTLLFRGSRPTYFFSRATNFNLLVLLLTFFLVLVSLLCFSEKCLCSIKDSI